MKTHLIYRTQDGETKHKRFATIADAQSFLEALENAYGKDMPVLVALFTGKLYRTYLYDREKQYA